MVFEGPRPYHVKIREDPRLGVSGLGITCSTQEYQGWRPQILALHILALIWPKRAWWLTSHQQPLLLLRVNIASCAVYPK